ncbi:MAG: amidohydrolase [Actinomycetota bacterium]|nr:amidohydrolase [Actinomycetota bacterium]
MEDHQPFDIVDTQVHITTEMTADRILTSMDALGINSVIIDEFWTIDGYRVMPSDLLADGTVRPVSPYAHAAAIQYPERVAYLQRVERRDPHLAEAMTLLASSPGCRAVRIVILSGAERASFTDGSYDNVLSLAQAHDLPICVLGVDAVALPAVATRFPDLQIVLDHCGWPRSPDHWEDVLRLSAQPNVSMKWSHASRAFRHADDYHESRQREFLRAIEAFGIERIMWASDVTQDESSNSWAELLSFVRDNPSLSRNDKEWILGRAARRLYRWDAPTSE